MNAHQLDANGVILNTILVDSLSVFPNLVDASIGGSVGDSIINGVVITHTPALIVPQKVTRRQARQALLLFGLLDSVEPAIAAIPNLTERRLAQIEWEDSLEFERSRPLLIALGTALGLSSAQLDNLFIEANKL